MADIKALARYNWKYVVVDEGHRLKNAGCRLIRDLKLLPADNKLLLTGELVLLGRRRREEGRGWCTHAGMVAEHQQLYPTPSPDATLHPVPYLLVPLYPLTHPLPLAACRLPHPRHPAAEQPGRAVVAAQLPPARHIWQPG
jgi:SNF2-related domain